MLIDAHVHLLPTKRLAGLLRWMHRFAPWHPIPLDVTLEDCIRHYEKLGVDYLFNFAYPIDPEETDGLMEFNRDLGRRFPWIIPFGSLHPANPDKAGIVDRCIREYGFLGFKFHSFIQKFDPLDPRMQETYQRIHELGRPCVFHTGFEEWYGLSLPVSTMEEVARNFPKMTVVFAHSLFPYFADAWRIMERYDNVWVEMTNVFGSLYDPRYRLGEYAEEKRTLLEGLKMWSSRVMFGTDHPAGMGTLEEIYQTLDAIGLPETTREDLIGRTAERFIRRFRPAFFEAGA